MNGKVCTKCLEFKTIENFSPRYMKYASHCKPCHADDQARYIDRVKGRKKIANIQRATNMVLHLETIVVGIAVITLFAMFLYIYV